MQWLEGTGVTLQRQSDDQCFLIRFGGEGVSAEMIETIMFEIRKTLEKC
jgi:hypothetical protein